MSDPSLFASHLNGPWHVVCEQKGAGFVTDRSLAENFHVITKHHCAVLLSKDTLELDYTLIQVFWLFMYFSWSVQGLVVPVSSAEHPTRRTFILRLLTFIFTLSVPRGGLGALRCCSSAVTCASSLVRLCFPATSRLSSVELSLVILVPAVSRHSRPPSAMPAFLGPPQAFRCCGVLAASPVAIGGPECCGFVMLPESQNQWLIMWHGSFDVNPATIGLKSTDQAWHYAQCLHLACARRERSRDASPTDSNSRRRS